MIDEVPFDVEIVRSIFFPLLEHFEDLIIKAMVLQTFNSRNIWYQIKITMRMDNPELFCKLQKIHESHPNVLSNTFNYSDKTSEHTFCQSSKKIHPTRTVITKDIREDSIDKYNEIDSENKTIILKVDEALKTARNLGAIIKVEYPIKKIPNELFKQITYGGSIEFKFHSHSTFSVFLENTKMLDRILYNQIGYNA